MQSYNPAPSYNHTDLLSDHISSFISLFNWQWETGFMIKILFVYHTLAKLLRFQIYFLQRTTNALLFKPTKEKMYMYRNKNLIKIYFIFIFGKETNIHLAHVIFWLKLANRQSRFIFILLLPLFLLFFSLCH